MATSTDLRRSDGLWPAQQPAVHAERHPSAAGRGTARPHRAVTGNDLGCHFADPPRLVTERREQRRQRLVVPDIEQPTCSPDTKPVSRSGLAALYRPASRTTSKCHDQRRVYMAAFQHGDAAGYECGAPNPLTLSRDVLARGRTTSWPSHAHEYGPQPNRSEGAVSRSLSGCANRWPSGSGRYE